MTRFMEFWCINYDGITLFHQREKAVKSVDKNLISGFLSVFQNMLRVSKQGDVESIKFKGSKLNIIGHAEPYNLYFIARTEDREKERIVKRDLKKLSENFIKKYSDIVQKWDGEIDRFSEFAQALQPYFNKSVNE